MQLFKAPRRGVHCHVPFQLPEDDTDSPSDTVIGALSYTFVLSSIYSRLIEVKHANLQHRNNDVPPESIHFRNDKRYTRQSEF